MKLGKFYGVGIGPGDPRYLTVMAVDILRSVELIFTVVGRNSKFSVSRKVIDSVTQVKAEKRELTFSMARDWDQRRQSARDNAVEILTALKAGSDCAFATLGDPMTYSTFGYLLKILQEELPDLETEVVPGITSFAALAAKTKTVLVEDDESLHVFPGQNVERPETIELKPKSANVILKSYKNRNRLVEYFSEQEGCSLIYGSRLCLDGEFTATEASEIVAHPDEYLSLMIIKKD